MNHINEVMRAWWSSGEGYVSWIDGVWWWSTSDTTRLHVCVAGAPVWLYRAGRPLDVNPDQLIMDEAVRCCREEMRVACV